MVDQYAKLALLGRAAKKKLIAVRGVNLRDFSNERHKKVDDAPFGGGPGMVMQLAPVYRAVRKLKKGKKTRVILFSTRGKTFDQKTARRLGCYDHLIFIAGRYEGVDERVARHVADEELSLGDFVLAGGELPALVVIEAVARHIPGVLGKHESLEEKKGSYPVYTRPAAFSPAKRTQWKVPPVLMSGDHAKIAKWRKEKGSER